MSDPIKRMDIREFRELGYLQEANRRFFHPLGLALEVVTSDPEDGDQSWRLGGIWEYREDPEGITFSREGQSPSEAFTPEMAARADFVDAEIAKRAAERMRIFGSDSPVEPVR